MVASEIHVHSGFELCHPTVSLPHNDWAERAALRLPGRAAVGRWSGLFATAFREWSAEKCQKMLLSSWSTVPRPAYGPCEYSWPVARSISISKTSQVWFSMVRPFAVTSVHKSHTKRILNHIMCNIYTTRAHFVIFVWVHTLLHKYTMLGHTLVDTLHTVHTDNSESLQSKAA